MDVFRIQFLHFVSLRENILCISAIEVDDFIVLLLHYFDYGTTAIAVLPDQYFGDVDFFCASNHNTKDAQFTEDYITRCDIYFISKLLNLDKRHPCSIIGRTSVVNESAKKLVLATK